MYNLSTVRFFKYMYLIGFLMVKKFEVWEENENKNNTFLIYLVWPISNSR